MHGHVKKNDEHKQLFMSINIFIKTAVLINIYIILRYKLRNNLARQTQLSRECIFR